MQVCSNRDPKGLEIAIIGKGGVLRDNLKKIFLNIYLKNHIARNAETCVKTSSNSVDSSL